MNLIDVIKKEGQKFFHDAKGSHDWEHTERVYNLCMHIAKKEKAQAKDAELQKKHGQEEWPEIVKQLRAKHVTVEEFKSFSQKEQDDIRRIALKKIN